MTGSTSPDFDVQVGRSSADLDASHRAGSHRSRPSSTVVTRVGKPRLTGRGASRARPILSAMSCEDGDCTHNWHYAPHRSLYGALELGRGIAVARLRHQKRQAELVYRCCARDTRWDWQVDSRCTYLARLLRDLRLDVAPLIVQLYACGPATCVACCYSTRNARRRYCRFICSTVNPRCGCWPSGTPRSPTTPAPGSPRCATTRSRTRRFASPQRNDSQHDSAVCCGVAQPVDQRREGSVRQVTGQHRQVCRRRG